MAQWEATTNLVKILSVLINPPTCSVMGVSLAVLVHQWLSLNPPVSTREEMEGVD